MSTQNPVSSHAEASPARVDLSRRAILRGAPSVAALAVAAALPTVAMAATTSENPELVDLGGQLEAVKAAFADADQARRAARQLCDSLAPGVPDELIVSARDECYFSGLMETDAEGHEVWRDAAGVRQTTIPCNQLRRREIIPAKYLRIDVEDKGPRTKVGRIARRKLAIAERYETDMRIARERSDIDAAIVACKLAENELMSVARKVASAPALTMEGLGIKARALLACAMTQGGHLSGLMFGGSLAESVVSVLGSHA